MNRRPFLLALVGAWVLWMAFLVFVVRADDSLRATGAHTIGVVLSVDDEDFDADVRFVTDEGEEVVTNVHIVDGADLPSRNDEVEVIYDQSNPQRAVFPNETGVKDWLMRWVALPIVGLAPGALILVWARRSGRDVFN